MHNKAQAALALASPREQPDALAAGGVEVDLGKHEVRAGGRMVELTFLEFQLLHYLIVNKGRAIPREKLYREVWGGELLRGGRTIDVHVRRLRAKLGEPYAEMVRTVRKVGYRLVEPRVG